MSRVSKAKAWDWLQSDIEHVTQLGANVEHTKAQTDLHAALDALRDAKLPNATVINLAAAIEAAYAIGRERNAK